jgi:hypothetical protein
MQSLEVSGAVRHIYMSLGVKGLKCWFCDPDKSALYAHVYTVYTTYINVCTHPHWQSMHLLCSLSGYGPASLTAAKQCEIIAARSHCIPTWAVRYCCRCMASNVSMANDCSCDMTPAASSRIRLIRLFGCRCTMKRGMYHHYETM